MIRIALRAHPHSRGENSTRQAPPSPGRGSSPLTRGKRPEASNEDYETGLIPTHAGKTRQKPATEAKTGAHPHSRGENAVYSWRAPSRSGSSPLTRGKLYRAGRLRSGHRLIPTHAGKTAGSRRCEWPRRAHPHSRGENVLVGCGVVGDPGSSPLTRGKQCRSWRLVVFHGLIPTHAGKTRSALGSPRPPQAHPHSRGENEGEGHRLIRRRGSSPLTRGKRGRHECRSWRLGLIPTHAGKTTETLTTWPANGAHPHSRGENSTRTTKLSAPPGSSPLTRGKQALGWVQDAQGGLIPTHAGKTRPWLSPSGSRTAHPHSRGENYGVEIELSQGYGSSPLTRGKLRVRADQPGKRRLIPTHAGKTPRCFLGGNEGGAHPHSRGENSCARPRTPPTRGSSPLTRGKHLDGGSVEITGRLIPTHAGKTKGKAIVSFDAGAHPHSRGENTASRPPPCRSWGSSPLTRGKQRSWAGRACRPRLIPTHAGKT